MAPLTPTLDRIPAQTPVQRWAVRVATAIAFAATWIFRWLTIDFANDHFVHLSRARQILLGELPVRDFFDPGLPLHYYASAAALTISGQNLLGEAVLTVTLIALGAALTFYLAARSSRSLMLATVATVVAVAMFPRLYNYPKVFLYPLALACVWHYATRRTTVALAALAGMTAIAALFRLDHGFYIGASAAVGLVLANRDRIRAIPAVAVRFRGDDRCAAPSLPDLHSADGGNPCLRGRHPAEQFHRGEGAHPLVADTHRSLDAVDRRGRAVAPARLRAVEAGHQRRSTPPARDAARVDRRHRRPRLDLELRARRHPA